MGYMVRLKAIYDRLQFRRLVCWLFGHRFYYEPHDTVLPHGCQRCRKASGACVSTVDCNWKKRKAKFVDGRTSVHQFLARTYASCIGILFAARTASFAFAGFFAG
jgi:hypothetical protein